MHIRKMIGYELTENVIPSNRFFEVWTFHTQYNIRLDVMTTAIYYQKSDVVQEEFKLIEVATLRELVVEKLQKVLREVKERRRELDDAAILETFALFNRVREATVDIIRSISVWQESFTKPLRPRLLDCDYVVDRLLYHIDFINATNLKRIFNFQFYRGNFLLLPYPNPKTVDPVRISTALGREIRAFAAPPEEAVLCCYQFMINCLPEAVYQDKVAPLKRWLMAGWVPRVWVMDVKPTAPTEARPGVRRQQAPTTPTGSIRGSILEDSAGKMRRSSSATGPSPAGETSTVPAASPGHRLLRRRSTIGSTNSNKSKDKDETQGKGSKTRIKRRNQMNDEETAQLKTMVVDTAHGTSDPSGNNGSAEDLQALQMDEYLRAQREKKEKEISGLDLYFQEMELLFTPALGRRAVQTVVVGGTRTDETQEYHEPITHELFHQPDKIVFHHTYKEEAEHLDAIVADRLVPEGSKRVSAELVTKRNRIMADRGQPTRDRKYEKHKQIVDFSSYKRTFDRTALLSTQPQGGFEVLFTVSDPNQQGKDKVALNQSEKAAAAYLKNKYSTSSTRGRSRDSGDAASEAGRSRRGSVSGATLDSFTVKSGDDESQSRSDKDAKERSPPSEDRRPRTASEAGTDDEVPPPPLDTPMSVASVKSGKLPAVRREKLASPPGSAKARSRKAASPSPDRAKVPPKVGNSPAAAAPDTVGFEDDLPADTEPGDRDAAEARRQRRRESRRMSDLTVTFSVKSGGDEEESGDKRGGRAAGGATGDMYTDGNNPTAELLPLLGQLVRTASPQRLSQPTMQRTGSSVKSHAGSQKSPVAGKQMSPARSTAVSDHSGSIAARRRTSSFESQSERSRGSAARSDGTNEYGIKIKAGTPPKASAGLTVTTDSMRMMFAKADETDANSTYTNDT
jgi:hypothetical protein